ncbi:hypothetical protein Vadar_026084 [Vaccinium darrowii]|uniref:Uncharacterized protein n=1 Tax=Vaccinium darrowii TaxID=229202 RepID=A0ACB7XK00_9ERIC|nr:hypothetical protein Vadar_026084 [Vaccinium darrowii]
MYQRLQNLRQNSRSVDDYTTEFHQLVARNDLVETEEQLVARYVGGLREQFQFTLNMFELFSVSDAYQKALQLEKQAIRKPSSTPWSATARPPVGNTSTKPIASLPPTNPPAIRAGKALFVDSDGIVNEQCKSYEQEAAYDEEVVEEAKKSIKTTTYCHAHNESELASNLKHSAKDDLSSLVVLPSGHGSPPFMPLLLNTSRNLKKIGGPLLLVEWKSLCDFVYVIPTLLHRRLLLGETSNSGKAAAFVHAIPTLPRRRSPLGETSNCGRAAAFVHPVPTLPRRRLPLGQTSNGGRAAAFVHAVPTLPRRRSPLGQTSNGGRAVAFVHAVPTLPRRRSPLGETSNGGRAATFVHAVPTLPRRYLRERLQTVGGPLPFVHAVPTLPRRRSPLGKTSNCGRAAAIVHAVPTLPQLRSRERLQTVGGPLPFIHAFPTSLGRCSPLEETSNGGRADARHPYVAVHATLKASNCWKTSARHPYVAVNAALLGETLNGWKTSMLCRPYVAIDVALLGEASNDGRTFALLCTPSICCRQRRSFGIRTMGRPPHVRSRGFELLEDLRSSSLCCRRRCSFGRDFEQSEDLNAFVHVVHMLPSTPLFWERLRTMGGPLRFCARHPYVAIDAALLGETSNSWKTSTLLCTSSICCRRRRSFGRDFEWLEDLCAFVHAFPMLPQRRSPSLEGIGNYRRASTILRMLLLLIT